MRSPHISRIIQIRRRLTSHMKHPSTTENSNVSPRLTTTSKPWTWQITRVKSRSGQPRIARSQQNLKTVPSIQLLTIRTLLCHSPTKCSNTSITFQHQTCCKTTNSETLTAGRSKKPRLWEQAQPIRHRGSGKSLASMKKVTARRVRHNWKSVSSSKHLAQKW